MDVQKFESWAKHGPTTAEQIIGYSFLKYVKRVSADEIYKNLCSIVPLNKFIMPQHKLKKITKFMPVSVAKNINVIYKNMLSWILRRNRAKNSKKKITEYRTTEYLCD